MRWTMGRAAAVVAVSVLAAGLAPAKGYPRPGRTEQITLTPTGAPGSGAPEACSSNLTCSAQVDITPDGRFVAFAAVFGDLVPDDTNSVFDVFVRDLQRGTTERVSVGSGGEQADGGSAEPSISDDGRYVAFVSQATNLGPAATGSGEVYVRDRATGTTVLASISPSGAPGDGARGSDNPRISGDGRFVAFASNAFGDDTTNDARLPGGGINFGHVYVRDLQAGTTELVTVPDGGGRSTSAETYGSSLDISGDGRYVAFEARRHDLVAGDTNGMVDIFVRDRVARRTERVSVASDGSQGNWVSYNPRISADGRYVAFTSAASNLVPSDTNSSGRTAGGFDVFVHDRQTDQTRRVSVASSGAQTPPGYDSYWLDLSPDGRFVAFDSTAPNLGGPANGQRHVYVHDITTGATDLASIADGQAFTQTGFSSTPALSGDAAAIAFVAPSTTTPFDQAVYIRHRGPALGVRDLATVAAGSHTTVSGAATFDGAVVTQAVASPAAAPGLGLAGASLTFRPEAEDLLVRWSVPGLPATGTPAAGTNYAAPAAAAGVPGAVHTLGFSAGGRRFEVRAARDATGPTWTLFDCTAGCALVATLEGGYGTAADEITAAIPLARLAIGPGAGLTGVVATAGLGAPGAALGHEVQRLSLPDGGLPVPSVRVSGAGASVSAVLSAGRFTADLAAPAGSAVTVTACLGTRCSPTAHP